MFQTLFEQNLALETVSDRISKDMVSSNPPKQCSSGQEVASTSTRGIPQKDWGKERTW